jgi:arylformamidase
LSPPSVPPAAWIDVSVPVTAGMVAWPGDPPVRIVRAQSIERGDEANITHLDMGAHTGTHMDAPAHFLDGAAGIDSMPLEATIGPARVIALEAAGGISAEELRRHEPAAGERLLIKTRNSERPWDRETFKEDFVHVAPDAAAYLAERGIRTVGVDYLSVGGYGGGSAETHQALLGAGIWIIEGLYLGGVAPGPYELVCLPIRLAGADGAPARALLRPV